MFWCNTALIHFWFFGEKVFRKLMFVKNNTLMSCQILNCKLNINCYWFWDTLISRWIHSIKKTFNTLNRVVMIYFDLYKHSPSSFVLVWILYLILVFHFEIWIFFYWGCAKKSITSKSACVKRLDKSWS